MMLSDTDIRERLGDDLLIDPIEDLDVQLQPASFDLRLSDSFVPVSRLHFLNLVDDGEVLLCPGDFILGSTIETVTMPDDLVARVEGRSSLGRKGLIVHATAGFIDPGFSGQITLEMTNISGKPLRIPIGMRVCQLAFNLLRSPATRPYGSKYRNSKYQGQKGATISRLNEEL